MIKKLYSVTLLVIGLSLFSCGGSGDPKESSEYKALLEELNNIKMQDSLEASNIATYKQMNEDFMNGKKEEFLAKVADNYLDHNPDTAMSRKEGKESCIEMFDMITNAFSEMSMSYLHIYGEGDMVYCHATMNGKNTGDMGPGMPATNGSYKDVEFYEVVRFENGLMVERWGLMDMMSMMGQLGATM